MNAELTALLAHMHRGVALLEAHLSPNRIEGQVFPEHVHQEYPKVVVVDGVDHTAGSAEEEAALLAPPMHESAAPDHDEAAF